MRKPVREVYRYVLEYDVLPGVLARLALYVSTISWIIICGNWLYVWFNYGYMSPSQFNRFTAFSILYTLLIALSIGVAFTLPYFIQSVRPRSFKHIREARLRDIVFVGSLILLLIVISAYIILGYYYMENAVT